MKSSLFRSLVAKTLPAAALTVLACSVQIGNPDDDGAGGSAGVATGGSAGLAGSGGAAGAGGEAGSEFVPNDKAPPPAAIAALDPRTVPMAALGDVDDDGDVDGDDQKALTDALATGTVANLGCEAAGDLDMDGQVSADDAAVMETMLLETGTVHAPMLFAQPTLPCGFASSRLAAKLDVMPGEMGMLRLMDSTLLASQVKIDVIDNLAEAAVSEDDRGFVIYPSEDLTPGSMITFVLTFPAGAQYVYTLPIVEVPAKDDELASAPPPPKIYGEEIDDEPICPERGKGCQALIIDFSRHVWYEFDADELVPKLQALGCTTKYVAPKMVRKPQPIVIGLTILGPLGPTTTIKPSAKAIAAAKAVNLGQWAAVKAAVAAHKKAAAGKDMVFQLVNAHGGKLLCGTWGPSFWSNGTLWRDDFHEGIYKSTLRQSCGSISHDLSCYSGLTPKALNHLNNTGSDNNCKGKPAMDHTKHAGHDWNVATGTAPTTDTCTNGDVGSRVSELGQVLQAELAANKGKKPKDHKDLTSRFHTEAFVRAPSAYFDSGYAECKPADHTNHY